MQASENNDVFAGTFVFSCSSSSWNIHGIKAVEIFNENEQRNTSTYILAIHPHVSAVLYLNGKQR